MIRSAMALFAALSTASPAAARPPRPPAAAAIDSAVRAAMARTGTRGFALAVIDNGRVRSARAWGARNAAGDPLQPGTVMYAASITKAVFAYTVLQMADEGLIDLDRSIADYLPRPLPDYNEEEERYAPWHHLAGDERWRRLTARILLSHRAGFANFFFLEPDGRLQFHFDPGARFSYSGDAQILLQFVLERGLGMDLGREMQRRVFDRLGMPNSAMMWRADFRRNLAGGWRLDGSVEPHDERSAPRAAGSLDTSIADLARFAAAFVRGEGLSPARRAEMVRSQQPVLGVSQFPVLVPDPPHQRWPGLGTGLGVMTFQGPQGPGFFRGGHNDSTGNMWVCVERGRRCVLMMANDVRAEAFFQEIATLVLGETGLPWGWVYPQYAR